MSPQGYFRGSLYPFDNARRNVPERLSLPLEYRAHRVAALEHRRRPLEQRVPLRHVPAERIGEADDHAEEGADGRRVAQRLVGDTGGARLVGVGRRQLVRAERQLLEEDERRLELGTQRRGAPIVDDRLPDFLAERVRRNCAVGPRSEGALVE
jgi:hypothetical protein